MHIAAHTIYDFEMGHILNLLINLITLFTILIKYSFKMCSIRQIGMNDIISKN